MWLVHPLPISQNSLKTLLEKQVATKSSSSTSFTIWECTSCCSIWLLQMTTPCPSWLHLLHLALGLLQHLNDGCLSLLQCLQGGYFLLELSPLLLLLRATPPFFVGSACYCYLCFSNHLHDWLVKVPQQHLIPL